MIPSIARNGYPIILTVLFLASLTLCAALITDGIFSQCLKTVAIFLWIFFMFSLFFFRDPERFASPNPQNLLCPADGTILSVKEVDETMYLKKRVKRISIFMSVFNVHVNRSPLDGTIAFMHYNKGMFISAFKEKASDDNESLFVGFKGKNNQRIALKFIAGLIARRIVFYKELQDSVTQGERINLIRFGSRVDVYCDVETDVLVSKGDKVKAGETILARFKN